MRKEKKSNLGLTYSMLLMMAFLVAIAAILSNQSFIFDWRSRAGGTPANIVIDTSQTIGVFDNSRFRAFTQGGEERTDMLAPVLNLVKDLKPRIIRIDHIFDYYAVVSRVDGRIVYDFNRLDKTVDTIIGSGAIPLFSLSYMPEAIAKNGDITEAPVNWFEWSDIVKETVMHYSGKSRRNLSWLYYEVWNEPDLFGKWTINGSKNYLDLYHYAVMGANNAGDVNAFYIGGPATTGLYKNWIEELVKSGDRIDFFSWHTYNADPEQFTKDEQDMYSWLGSYPDYRKLPHLITEFSLTGEKDKRYGTEFASAYTLAVFRSLLDFNTIPFVFEIKDGPDISDNSGWGLIGHENKGSMVKSRYQIYKLLYKLEGERLRLSGEGSWVSAWATKKDGVIRIILNNYDREENHIENVPLELVNLENGEYVINQTNLEGKQYSATAEVTDRTLKKQIYLGINKTVLLEISGK